MLGICKSIEAKRSTVSPQGSAGVVKKKDWEIPEERKRFGNKKQTASEIANEIVRVDMMDGNSMALGEGFKQRILFELADREYTPEGR